MAKKACFHTELVI